MNIYFRLSKKIRSLKISNTQTSNPGPAPGDEHGVGWSFWGSGPPPATGLLGRSSTVRGSLSCVVVGRGPRAKAHCGGRKLSSSSGARLGKTSTGGRERRPDHGHGPNVLKLGLVGCFYVMGLCLCTLGQVGNGQNTFTSTS
jgi:hypothetical protein